ncbi:helix-hairpin-helix domain-containing protein [Fimbriiglobus ruber]|uniref:Crossover junction endonuclease MUS81-like HHH domain-containing protein n=1 Tax=Fimbriiglobus ruber TaxID=1908690 RepID=A0A225D8X2_9BACT|nr:helix-hairpin-helix domain-containing protein [Fimbriiglobus ruber]OWK38011.1 hypothetical protein FRUB_07131 [Fimbriiglobus ruber]
MTNDDIAQKLRTHATSLARSGNNLYRVRAFRQAAMAVLMLPTPVMTMLSDRGRPALEEVPGIGPSLAETIDEFTRTGDWKPRTKSRDAFCRR